MSKFRKKPIVIEATQWFKHGDHPAVTPATYAQGTWSDWGRQGWINTPEGGHVVSPGDWIITGVQGEHYPCKPDIFAATYEPVKQSNDVIPMPMTVGDLLKSLEGIPPTTRVTAMDGPVLRMEKELGASTPFVVLIGRWRPE